MQPGHLHHTATRQLRSYDRDEIGLVHLDRHRSSSIRLQAQRQRSQKWPEWFASSQPIQEQHGTTTYNPLQPLYPILSWGCTSCHESSWRDRVFRTSNLKHVSMRVWFICFLVLCLERRIKEGLQAQFCFWSEVTTCVPMCAWLM